MRAPLRLATALAPLTVIVLLSACLEDRALPLSPDPPAGDAGKAPARVLVVNTLSETLSSLDPATGALSVQAALGGTWVNRITAAPGGRRLLLTNSGANEVQVLDAVDLATLATIDLGPGRSPWTAVPADAARMVVTNWLTGTVRLAVVSGDTSGPPLATTAGPEGVAVRDGLAWIACTNYRSSGSWGPGRVDVVDLAAWRVVASVTVGSNPQDLAFANDGLLHVVCTGAAGEDGAIHVIDPAMRMVTSTVALGGSPGRLVADASGLMWTIGFEGGLRRYATNDGSVLPDPADPALRGSGLSAIAFDPVRDAMFVTSFDGDLLLEVDRADASIRQAWLVGDGPVDVLVHRPENPNQRGRPDGQNE